MAQSLLRLTEAVTRYAQIEKESKRLTDHKPLVPQR